MIQNIFSAKDPFDSVVFEKYIDNGLLTSARALSKLSNTFSECLKVVHIFTPKMTNGNEIGLNITVKEIAVNYKKKQLLPENDSCSVVEINNTE